MEELRTYRFYQKPKFQLHTIVHGQHALLFLLPWHTTPYFGTKTIAQCALLFTQSSVFTAFKTPFQLKYVTSACLEASHVSPLRYILNPH